MTTSDLPSGRLIRLVEIREQRSVFWNQVRTLDRERNTLIAECFQTGEADAAALSKATGLSRQGIRQIRDKETQTAESPTLPIRIGRGVGRA